MSRHRTKHSQAVERTTGIIARRLQTARRGRGTGKPALSVVVLFLFITLPAVAVSYQERLILSTEVGRCSLRVEADDQSRTLRLRAHSDGPTCAVAKEVMIRTLAAAFAKNDPPRLEGTYSSLFIGRLIDFPWLSQYLALAAYKDREWNREKGKPAAMGINKYVATILGRREVTSQIEEAFGDSGYRVTGVSVEKVLVGGFRDVPLYEGERRSGKVPFDGMVWFRLQKR